MAGRPSDALMADHPSAAPTLDDAIVLAVDAHRGQMYPSPEGEPYICHPLRVMLAQTGERERLAAVLHDVIEDSPLTLDDLRRRGYPPEVVKAIDCLTHRPGETYAAYIERVTTDEVACRVKLADLADNLANNRRLPDTPETRARIRRYLQAQARIEVVLRTA
jgi:(p)ppGpp synthase/HD superfamily hydrolase